MLFSGFRLRGVSYSQEISIFNAKFFFYILLYIINGDTVLVHVMLDFFFSLTLEWVSVYV